MTVSVWKVIPNFKIKSMKDVSIFIKDSLTSRQSYYVKVTHEFMIIINKLDNINYEVGYKYGDLYDPFNPTVIFPDDIKVKAIYKYRKAINNYFFSDEV